MDENKCLFAMNGMLKTDICHHGIKGQKWGVRRYQNPDGSLTPAGRIRYLDYDKNNSTLSKQGKKYFKPDGKANLRGKLKGYQSVSDELKKYAVINANVEKIKTKAPKNMTDNKDYLELKTDTKAANGGKISVNVWKPDLKNDEAADTAIKILNNPKKYADIGVKEIKRLIKKEMAEDGYMYETNDPDKVLSGASIHLSPRYRDVYEVVATANYTNDHSLIATLHKDQNGKYRSSREGLEWYG